MLRDDASDQIADLIDEDLLAVFRGLDDVEVGMNTARGEMAGPALAAGLFLDRRGAEERIREALRKAPLAGAGRPPQQQGVRHPRAALG